MAREDEIRVISYALWVREGRRYGSAIKRWLEAEAIWEQNQKLIQTSSENPLSREKLPDRLTTVGTR